MNISEWLLQAARVSPDAPAIRCGLDLHATYGQFAARSAGMATYLSDTLASVKVTAWRCSCRIAPNI
ncbi:hypothetical protein [uncultured Sulfitobacter sp.]|uniref:hypothetical protein n=1 Tax=uncultured Sulfitobacter sp. TaxID=191468 RepID=UPI00259812B4|nr:hypothetical protein [uncultured Sulfitobacter sp.]